MTPMDLFAWTGGIFYLAIIWSIIAVTAYLFYFCVEKAYKQFACVCKLVVFYCRYYDLEADGMAGYFTDKEGRRWKFELVKK